MRRHTVGRVAADRGRRRSWRPLEYDPRFVVFEFASNLILRKEQVEIIRKRRLEDESDSPAHVQQLIMGAGKTTTISPLLALLLADGQTLVLQVVPPALLTFSRAVMREKFSSVIAKPVNTFRFDRASEVNDLLLKKLQTARDRRAVVCATPTALKSFALKFIELANDIDELQGSAPSRTRAASWRARSRRWGRRGCASATSTSRTTPTAT